MATVTTTQIAITQQQSLAYVRATVTSAISVVCYLRGILPDECFKDQYFASIQAKKIVPKHPDAEIIQKWINEGVIDAIEKKYLREVALCIYTADQSTLIETYSIELNYDEKGNPRVGLSADDSQGLGTTYVAQPRHTKITKQSVIQGLDAIMRGLISAVQQLPPLPPDHVVTMRLGYYDDRTPSDYQPSEFIAADHNMVRLHKKEIRQSVALNSSEVPTGSHGLVWNIKKPAANNSLSHTQLTASTQQVDNETPVPHTHSPEQHPSQHVDVAVGEPNQDDGKLPAEPSAAAAPVSTPKPSLPVGYVPTPGSSITAVPVAPPCTPASAIVPNIASTNNNNKTTTFITPGAASAAHHHQSQVTSDAAGAMSPQQHHQESFDVIPPSTADQTSHSRVGTCVEETQYTATPIIALGQQQHQQQQPPAPDSQSNFNIAASAIIPVTPSDVYGKASNIGGSQFLSQPFYPRLTGQSQRPYLDSVTPTTCDDGAAPYGGGALPPRYNNGQPVFDSADDFHGNTHAAGDGGEEDFQNKSVLDTFPTELAATLRTLVQECPRASSAAGCGSQPLSPAGHDGTNQHEEATQVVLCMLVAVQATQMGKNFTPSTAAGEMRCKTRDAQHIIDELVASGLLQLVPAKGKKAPKRYTSTLDGETATSLVIFATTHSPRIRSLLSPQLEKSLGIVVGAPLVTIPPGGHHPQNSKRVERFDTVDGDDHLPRNRLRV